MSEIEDLKKAYEILGLPEDATREQVENRYFILMKQARAAQSRTEEANDEENRKLDHSEINRAYNLVLGMESGKISTVEKPTKLAHFFHYYRLHVIVGIIIVLVAGYMIKEGIDNRRAAANLPPSSLSVSVFGDFYFADAEILEKNMLELIPDWQRIDTKLVFVPTEIKSQQDMAMQQKSVLMLMTERSELYITDELSFKNLSAQGAFVNLKEFEASHPLNIPADKIRKAKSEDDTEEQPYGIDITGNPIFKNIELNGQHTIIAIRAKEEKWDNTGLLLEKLIQTTP
ncbi:hypothetical protein [Cohnella abietis]|uniref:J domain-containing protein n=1 Tax=Cohnella abietis TaxID=2507935 RepID=A0A3T1DB61_9BACL|nr:hypothetical protein [Cohnella abietis]BBI35347.1 hypothetical protein KCTCHS21_47460 [Cohnella abietis]